MVALHTKVARMAHSRGATDRPTFTRSLAHSHPWQDRALTVTRKERQQKTSRFCRCSRLLLFRSREFTTSAFTHCVFTQEPASLCVRTVSIAV